MGALLEVATWWPGDDTNYVVLGFSVKTWGRIGKVMQYVGGLVALIDILGEEWFQTAASGISARADRSRDVRLWYVLPSVYKLLLFFCIFMAVLFGIWAILGRANAFAIFFSSASAALILLALAFSPQLIGRGLEGIAYVSSSSLNMKTVGFVTVTIGFALDLLAS